MTAWEVPGTIVRWVDGDTLIADLDLGWHVRLRQAIRIDGIAAPEKATARGKVAKAFVEHAWPAGTAIVVVSRRILGSFEKYGRILADVEAELNGAESVGEIILAAGHALPWDGKGTQPA